jgi:hypothetical protein
MSTSAKAVIGRMLGVAGSPRQAMSCMNPLHFLLDTSCHCWKLVTGQEAHQSINGVEQNGPMPRL